MVFLVMLVVMLLTGISQAGGSVNVFVATNGNDAWSGRLAEPTADRTDGPFRTLERGRDALRGADASGSGKGGSVTVRGGLYPLSQSWSLDARDSGTADSPALFRAAPGEPVVLAGATVLPAEAFKPVADSAIRSRLDPAARDRVVQVHLPSLGIRDLGVYPVTNGNPGFVNADGGDFRLKPDSEVFSRLPGFQAIPLEKMGLYGDEWRSGVEE